MTRWTKFWHRPVNICPVTSEKIRPLLRFRAPAGLEKKSNFGNSFSEPASQPVTQDKQPISAMATSPVTRDGRIERNDTVQYTDWHSQHPKLLPIDLVGIPSILKFADILPRSLNTFKDENGEGNNREKIKFLFSMMQILHGIC